ncbi:MAG: carbon-nitrogen hydrolase family protein [Burkholderiaceae bacterium]
MTRIAIGQLRMYWTIEENMHAIMQAMTLAHARGAQICTFPELAVTGFHRQITALAHQELISPQIEKLQERCAQLNMALAIGAPTFADAGATLNSHFLIRETGEIAAIIHKNGLTAPEATFFQPGTDRPVAPLQGLRTTAVICREIEDAEHVCAQLPYGSVNLVLWPGQMRPDPAKPLTDPPAHIINAQQLARALGAYIVQANWPNALNRPEESEHTGASAVIAPSGVLMFRLPTQGEGVAVFSLGESTYEWHAQAE